MINPVGTSTQVLGVGDRIMQSYDPLTPAERSERMSLIRNADTKPEMIVRRLIHGMGYRYRLHSKDLPGHPDLVFRPRKKVVFVHGCFWHQHGCRQYRQPRSKRTFWLPKLEGNKERDKINQEKLRLMGWKFLVIWECELQNTDKLEKRITEFLGEKEK
jgi:DNA mismatch endonuclease (patch repair protein)